MRGERRGKLEQERWPSRKTRKTERPGALEMRDVFMDYCTALFRRSLVEVHRE